MLAYFALCGRLRPDGRLLPSGLLPAASRSGGCCCRAHSTRAPCREEPRLGRVRSELAGRLGLGVLGGPEGMRSLLLAQAPEAVAAKAEAAVALAGDEAAAAVALAGEEAEAAVAFGGDEAATAVAFGGDEAEAAETFGGEEAEAAVALSMPLR